MRYLVGRKLFDARDTLTEMLEVIGRFQKNRVAQKRAYMSIFTAFEDVTAPKYEFVTAPWGENLFL